MQVYLAEEVLIDPLDFGIVYAVFAEPEAAEDFRRRMEKEQQIIVMIRARTLIYGQAMPGYNK